MREWKLRGYLTPEDFEGTDARRIQQALDRAAELDIRKVVLTGLYRAETPLILPAQTHLVLHRAELHGDLKNSVSENWSFERDRIYIQGVESRLIGNVDLCHTRHAVLEDLEVRGDVTLGFSRDLRMERMKLSGTLTLGRGCANAIVQYIQADAAVITGRTPLLDCGREPTVRNIALRSSTLTRGVSLLAAEDGGLLNVQADGIRSELAAVTVGLPGEALPAEQYCNLTLTDLEAPQPVVLHNPCKHAFIR